jgi:Flp pilus assembly protein TadG
MSCRINEQKRLDCGRVIPRGDRAWNTAAGGWTFASFCRDDSGSVAAVFAAALIPLLGLSGFALDYARASLGKAQLQAAVDAAGLAVAHLPRNTPVAEVEKKAQEWVNTNLAGKSLGPVTVKAQKVGTSIVFTASTTVDLTLLKILREGPVEVAAGNEVSWDLGKVEIALVLDNTGSMVQNGSPKLANLKTAAKSLIDQLEDAATDPKQVKVGVVPFSMTVKVGSEYQTASWMDTTGASPINKEIFWNANPNRFTLLQNMGVTWGGCIEVRPSPHDVQESPPDAATPATLYVPFFAPDEPDSSSYFNNYLPDEVSSSSTWQKKQGWVDKYDQAPISGTNYWTGYKYGPNAGCSLVPLLRLTSDMSTVRAKIDSMTAVGETNIPVGLIWGWHMLSPNAPFKDGVAYNTPDLTKFVILMTDGENTNIESGNNNHSLYSSLGYIWQNRLGITSGDAETRTAAMDGKLATLCTNVKATGIQIFTVRVEVNSGSSSLLENCASSKDMFYNVANSADLNSVFSKIGDKITQLRLSK